MHNISRVRQDQPRGQALLEFALTLPILLMVLFGAAGFALVFFSFVTMQLAVREGTSAVVHDPKHITVSQVQDTVRSYMVTLDRSQVTINVEPSNTAQWRSGVQVSVTGIYNVSLPVQALGPIQLTAVSVMTIE